MIDLRHIDFAYRSRPVLQDVSCHIRAGRFVALVGPNGAGKSTLLKCIGGILKPQRGTILINAAPAQTYTPNQLAQTIAYIPQEKGSLQTLVFDALLSGRKPYIRWQPAAADIREVARVLRQLRIEHLSMKYVSELSGGEQQTVMIARALVQKTPILLLDEPTANLDLPHQLEVMQLLLNLSTNGLTILMSIHDINLAIPFATHVMMLKEGRLLAYGSTSNILTPETIEQLYNIPVDILQKDNTRYIIPALRP
ncbi:MAG: ABC transporter ATP-binding protein [Tannerellaceae bacterium]|jgi:iron complex transport system ATP-binding protein|nr:ABC transporter ATP-binding protein [Tannerellaceae bacterium]